MVTLLIIDDETIIRRSLRHHFERKGYRVAEAGTGREGLALVQQEDPDVVLLDLKLPDSDGLTILEKIKRTASDVAIIMLTAYGTYEKAVEAMRKGAEDFLIKEPREGNLAAMEIRVGKAVERVRRERVNTYYTQRTHRPSLDSTEAIPGRHPSMLELNNFVTLLAQNPHTTVLVLGESGTGKELVARIIHQKSARRDKPFVDINCAGLSENLLDSELFGHERGAFTDAKSTKRGLLEVADGGTVLLDEIGDMPGAVQPKLLRVLETKTFRRLGGTRDISVDIRIITATHQDLAQAVAEKSFREDLYYRLKVMPVEVPPLRERGEDVLHLAQLFVQEFNALLRRQVKGFSEQAQGILLAYQWPGNVRELRNVTERAIILCQEDWITPAHLPAEFQHLSPKRVTAPTAPQEAPTSTPGPTAGPRPGQLRTLEELERDYIREALETTGGNRSQTARLLGISRSTLQDKIKRYHL